MAKPQFKTLDDLKLRKIGISGLGAASHVAFLIALEKLGANPKDFTLIPIPAPQLLQSLESGFVDGALLNFRSPAYLFRQKKGLQ